MAAGRKFFIFIFILTVIHFISSASLEGRLTCNTSEWAQRVKPTESLIIKKDE